MNGSEAADYYQDFSLEVGLRDWIVPNPRHEQLKLLLGQVLGDRGAQSAPLQILDLGCGAGVMSEHLTSFGTVVASDFSHPAVELGRVMAPEVDFRVGSAEDEIPAGTYDVITLFDVMEHIPPESRATLVGRLASALVPGGAIVMSTPHPRYTRWLHEARPELLQVIDEPVDLVDLFEPAAAHGLALTRYETFDVDASGPQYQLLVWSAAPVPGSAPRRRHELSARLQRRSNPLARVLRRSRVAAGLARRGMPREALWFVIGQGRPPRSLRGGVR